MIPLDPPNLSELPGLVAVGDGPPIALAHGAGGGIETNFGPLIDELAATRRLVGVDYPGSGDTPAATGPLRLEDLADRLVGSMVASGHERFGVAGISLGSAVAIMAAHRHPEHVTALALSVGFAEPDANLTQAVRAHRNLVRAGLTLDAARLMLLLCSSPATLAALDESGTEEVVATIAAHQPAGALAQLDLGTRVDVRAEAAAISVPTRMFVSGQDRLVLPSSTRRLAAHVPAAEVVEYPEAGHIYTDAEARAWAHDVAEFLDR